MILPNLEFQRTPAVAAEPVRWAADVKTHG
jgi:hypothetical protein